MRRLLAAVTALALLAGCDSDPPARPPASAPASASPSAPVVAGRGEQSRTVDAAGDRVTVSVGPLVRSGEVVVLSVRARVERIAGGLGSTVVSRHFSGDRSTAFRGGRLVDERSRRVHLVAESSGGDCVCTGSLRVGAGDDATLQAAFAGVPAGVDRLSVMLPYAGVFADVPVVAGVVPAPADGGDALVLDDVASRVAGLGAYTERLDVGLRSRRTPERVDLELDTDVLFRLDSADLTPAAAETVAAAVADIEAAGAGPLTITGHTDDTGGTAHNQRLSQRRAEAVAAVLRGRLPDGKWPKTVAARGETQPLVPNESAAQRARNRRVTVSFRPAAAAPLPPSSAAAVALPPTKGVQGTARDGVEVTLPLNRGTVRFTPGAASVRGAFVQVDLVASNIGDDKATILDYLGQGVFTAREEFDPYAPYSASGVRLLAGDTAAYPVDYELEEGDHRCLCDRLLDQAIPPGTSRVLALWFPAPGAKAAGAAGATGATGAAEAATAVIDVPDKMRITGIPLS